MVTLTTGAASSSVLNTLSTPANGSRASISAFSDQLATALEAYLNGSSGNGGSHIEIDIAAAPGQDPGVRQFTVTLKDPIVASAPWVSSAPTAAPGAAPAASGLPTIPATVLMMGSAGNSVADRNPNLPVPAGPTEGDAYWAMQPPEVQKLRDIPDEAGRTLAAQILANQGFVIDPWIMVYGYDPYRMMRMREMSGFTWVPSWNQPNIASLPGCALSGMTPYDPSNPPAGSVRVTTEFAKGLVGNLPL
jgi:hypothetical protein